MSPDHTEKMKKNEPRMTKNEPRKQNQLGSLITDSCGVTGIYIVVTIVCILFCCTKC